MIHLYYGNGKGKTTCAVGSAIRNVGANGKVNFAQFMKDDSSSEINILNNIKQIKLFHVKENYGFSWEMNEETKKLASKAYTELFKETFSNKDNVTMIVLDEICSLINEKLIEYELVENTIKNCSNNIEVVMTGHNPDERLIELADYVSEINLIKHPYYCGTAARKGIEY